jgi:uracil-DNA glycosylase
MAKLSDRLRAELGGWQKMLSPSWRPHFKNTELAFDAVDPSATLAPDEKIWPQRTSTSPRAHLFKALKDLGPAQVRVVIFGNDPYTRVEQATGRSFEQGDLSDWLKDAQVRRRISPSLKSIVCAAAATDKANAGYDLTSRDDLDDGEEEWVAHSELTRGLIARKIRLPPPTKVFQHWAKQGVLWLNRTLTYTKWDEAHRLSHTRMWEPFTRRVLEVLVEQAKSKRPIVFALWGGPAKELERLIEELRQSAGSPQKFVRYVRTGHPQIPKNYFEFGNPLGSINKELGMAKSAIKWV